MLSALYEAALDQSLWPEALRGLMQLTESQAATFWVLDGTAGSPLSTFVHINFDPKTISEYLGGMASLDPTVRYLIEHPHACIVHDGMLGDGRDEDTRAYLDWHLRSVETRYRLVAQTDLGQGLQAGIALHRAPEAGRYESAEIGDFARLHAHLKRALTVGARLGSLANLERLSADLLERCGTALVLLDARRRVVFCNRAAEQLQARADGVRVSHQGELRLAQEVENGRLQGLISRALESANGAGRASGEAMRASRPAGKTPYGIWVSSLGRVPAALALFRPAVCILIGDPDRRGAPPVQHVQALFDLTPAEAKLAVLLATGESLHGAAERLGITYGTARSRMTALFEKTNTRSQSALVQLILTTIVWG